MLAAIEPAFRNAQFGEAALWVLIALALGYYASVQQGERRRRCLRGMLVFALFGASDVIEAYTGAWWKPWWLFVWKAACVLAMVWLLVDDVRARRREQAGEPPDGDGGASAGE